MDSENLSTNGLPLDVIAEILAHHKLEAIKKLKDQTGMGLADAKAAVEAWRPPRNDNTNGEPAGHSPARTTERYDYGPETNRDDETRRQLADAINGIVVMTESETEQAVDAVLDAMGTENPSGDKAAEWMNAAHMAAIDHQKHLRKAEGTLAKAKGLAETLRCALRSDDYDPEPFADEIAGSIVDLLGKVQSQIDKHSSRHSNLFLAYFDKKRAGDKPEASAAAVPVEARDHFDRIARTASGITAVCTSALENKNLTSQAHSLFRVILREVDRLTVDLDDGEAALQGKPHDAD